MDLVVFQFESLKIDKPEINILVRSVIRCYNNNIYYREHNAFNTVK